MNVIRCLLTASWPLVAFAGLAGLVSGLGGAALIAIIHAALSQPETSTAVLAWSFAGLCLLVFVSRIVSEVLLVRLGQATIASLRLQLSRQILTAPLRQSARSSSRARSSSPSSRRVSLLKSTGRRLSGSTRLKSQFSVPW